MPGRSVARSFKKNAITKDVKGGPREIHVASFFFATKQWQLDSNDRTTLKALAASCKSRVRLSGKLVGRVVGHADFRKSSSPTNQQLAKSRANEVWSLFSQAIEKGEARKIDKAKFVMTGLGDAESRRDPKCTRQGDESALANYRRADLYLTIAAHKEADDAVLQLEWMEERKKKIEAELPRLKKEVRRLKDHAGFEGSRKHKLEDTPDAGRAKFIKFISELVEKLADGPPGPGDMGREAGQKFKVIREYEEMVEKAEETLKSFEEERDRLEKAIREHPLRSKRHEPLGPIS